METGHAKNVAYFETITIVLAGLGEVYNPNQPLILLPALQTKLAAAKDIIATVDTAEANKKTVDNARIAEFLGIGKLAVNFKRTADVEINDAKLTKDLAAITRKFYGGRAGEKAVDDPSTPDIDESLKSNSVSQRSYNSLVEHFAGLIALVKAHGGYKTNDPEMQIAAVEAKLAALQAANNASIAADAALGNATDERDHILYDKDTGVLKLVKLIKTQLARKPGKDSAAYQQITALEFRKY